MSFSRFTCAALLLVCTTCGHAADAPKPDAAPPAPPSEAQVRAWVLELGSDDFDTRTASEAKLLVAPPQTAKAPLQDALQSLDAEVVLRARRILDRHFWMQLPPLRDPAQAMPADAFGYLGTPSAARLWTAIARDSELGRRLDEPAVKAFRQAFWNYLFSDDDDLVLRELIEKWPARFGGPCGLGYRPGPEGEPFPVELACLSPEAKPDEAEKLIAVAFEDAPLRTAYRGCTIYHDEDELFAATTASRIVLSSAGRKPLKQVLDLLAADAPETLAASPAFKEGLVKLGGEPLLHVHADVARLFTESLKHEMDEDEYANFMAMGFDTWPYGTFGLYVRDGLQIERVFNKSSLPLGHRKGWPQLVSFPRHDAKLAALCPPEAHAFTSLPLKGRETWTLAKALAKAMEWDEIPDFVELLEDEDETEARKTFERILDLYAGETAVWAVPKTDTKKAGEDLTVGNFEFYGALSEPSEADAKEVAAAAARFLEQLTGLDEIVLKSEHDGRTCYTFNKDVVRESLPYAYSWCADGRRVLIATSQSALKALIARNAKPAPGLDASPDYQRLLKTIPETERGAILYVNVAAWASWGYPAWRQGFLHDENDEDPTEAEKAVLESLPADPKVIFKDLPGLLATCCGQPDGFTYQASGGLAPSVCFATMMGILIGSFPK